MVRDLISDCLMTCGGEEKGGGGGLREVFARMERLYAGDYIG